MRNPFKTLTDLPWHDWREQAETALRDGRQTAISFAQENQPQAEEFLKRHVLPIGAYLFAAFALFVPLYLMLFGAHLFGVVSFIALCLLVWLPRFTRGIRHHYVQCGMSLLFVVTIGLGLPKANFIFQTQGCTYAASHPQFGHLGSLNDPRLSSEQRAWAERTSSALQSDWASSELPPISPLIVANMIVQSPLLVWELEWNPAGDSPEMGIYQAKSAYAGMIFDNRMVCALYDRIDRTEQARFRNKTLNRIKETTDAALALIVPALAETRQTSALQAASSSVQSQTPQRAAEYDGAYDQHPQVSQVSNAALVHAAP